MQISRDRTLVLPAFQHEKRSGSPDANQSGCSRMELRFQNRSGIFIPVISRPPSSSKLRQHILARQLDTSSHYHHHISPRRTSSAYSDHGTISASISSTNPAVRYAPGQSFCIHGSASRPRSKTALSLSLVLTGGSALHTRRLWEGTWSRISVYARISILWCFLTILSGGGPEAPRRPKKTWRGLQAPNTV